jgi:DNA polymerase III sliding clamp (beta) subunit (PCNA family)
VPKRATATIPLDAPAFLYAVRRSNIMIEQESCRLALAFEAGKVTLTTSREAGRNAVVVHPLPKFKGPDIRVALDSSHLIELLRHIGNSPARMRIDHEPRPVVIDYDEGPTAAIGMIVSLP